MRSHSSDLSTFDTSRAVRSQRSHSLEFTENDQSEPTLIGPESEMDIDIYTTGQLLGSVDVDTLLNEVATPRAEPSDSKSSLFSLPMSNAKSTEASDDSSVSDDSTSASSTLSVRTPTPVGQESTLVKKPQSKSRKELIIQQRKLLGELTKRLEELMSPPSRSLVDLDDQSIANPNSSLWKLASIRQLGRRREAEEENVRLRDMLELQVEEAKCLQRILKRRRKIQVMEEMLGMKRRRIGRFPSAPPDNNEIFAKMIQDADDLYANVDANFATKGFDEMPCPGQKRKVDRKVVSGVIYERLQKTQIPFEFRQSQKAVWKVLMEYGIGSVKRLKGFSNVVDFHSEQSDESCDTITSSYFAATPGISDVSGAQVRKVVRKYVDEDKVVFIAKVVSEPRGRCTTTSVGYHLYSILQIVMRRRVSSMEEEATQLSVYFSGHRQDSGLGIPAQFRRPEQLDIGIAMWDKMVVGIASEVENMLIDDTLAMKAKSKKSPEFIV